jgi:hypothetical protein
LAFDATVDPESLARSLMKVQRALWATTLAVAVFMTITVLCTVIASLNMLRLMRQPDQGEGFSFVYHARDDAARKRIDTLLKEAKHALTSRVCGQPAIDGCVPPCCAFLASLSKKASIRGRSFAQKGTLVCVNVMMLRQCLGVHAGMHTSTSRAWSNLQQADGTRRFWRLEAAHRT